jgi:hypothetical protein
MIASRDRMEITKQDLSRMRERLALVLAGPDCDHPNATESTEEGIVYFHCPDCGWNLATHPAQVEAWRRMA